MATVFLAGMLILYSSSSVRRRRPGTLIVGLSLLPREHTVNRVEGRLLRCARYEHVALRKSDTQASDQSTCAVTVVHPTPVADNYVVGRSAPDCVVVIAAEDDDRERRACGIDAVLSCLRVETEEAVGSRLQ